MADKEARDKQLDANDFTRDVESAIEDLFNPVKSIEIDPVTNEVKEVEGASEEKEPQDTGLGLEELELELGPELEEAGAQAKEAEAELVEPPTEETAEAPEVAPEEGGAASGEGGEFLEASGLELDLEDLELELEEAEAPESVADSESEEEEQQRESRFSRLYEAVLALEWEVSPNTIEDFRAAVEELRGDLADVPNGRGDELLRLCDDLKSVLDASPERMHPATPKLLSQAVEKTLALVKGENGDTEAELSALLRQLQELEVPEPAAEIVEPELVQPEGARELERELAETKAALEEERERGARLAEAVRVHLAVLEECIGRMEGLEQILSGMKGFEKLLQFNAWIHSRLEGEKVALADALEGTPYDVAKVKEVVRSTMKAVESAVGLSDVKREAEGRKGSEAAEEAPKQRPRPPFQELMVAECGEERLGLLPEEVSLLAPASKKVVQAVRSGGRFPLARLRKWPWSKISPLATGELAELGEGALRAMSLPVLAPTDSSVVDELVDPYIVVLFRKGKGGVCLVDGRPQTRPVQDGERWAPASSGGVWQGTFTTPVHSIRVLSVKGL